MKAIVPSMLASQQEVHQHPLTEAEHQLAVVNNLGGNTPATKAVFPLLLKDEHPLSQSFRGSIRGSLLAHCIDHHIPYPGSMQETKAALHSISDLIDGQCRKTLEHPESMDLLTGNLTDCHNMYKDFMTLSGRDNFDKKQIPGSLAMAVICQGVIQSDKTLLSILTTVKSKFESMPVNGSDWTCVFKTFGCVACGDMSSDDLKMCSACKIAKYCSEKCQREDWKEEHRASCKKIKNLVENS